MINKIKEKNNKIKIILLSENNEKNECKLKQNNNIEILYLKEINFNNIIQILNIKNKEEKNNKNKIIKMEIIILANQYFR